jgi:hypothetical protein
LTISPPKTILKVGDSVGFCHEKSTETSGCALCRNGAMLMCLTRVFLLIILISSISGCDGGGGGGNNQANAPSTEPPIEPPTEPPTDWPADNAVTVADKEWLQPADFTGYIYAQVSAVCLASDGVCSGSLQGSTFDLTGYKWASIDEVSALFNTYGVNPPFTEPFQEMLGDEQGAAAVALDFAATDIKCFGDCPVDIAFVSGMVRDPAPSGGIFIPNLAYADAFPASPPSFNNTGFSEVPPTPDDSIGIWLWRQAENPRYRDQGQILFTDGYYLLGVDEWSQSITTGIEGQLVEIQIHLAEGLPSPTPILTLSIADGDNPVSGNVLFSEDLDLSTADPSLSMLTWDLRKADIFFDIGDVFSFGLQADGVGYRIEGNNDPGYEGGTLYKNREMLADSDIAFTTYVEPPEEPPTNWPADNAVTVADKEWLQPDLFLNLSWNDINAVCPEGECSGTLNGYDMTGWTWASVEDMNALFNFYIGSDVLGPGPDSYFDSYQTAWAPAFFSDGWRQTFQIDFDDQTRWRVIYGRYRENDSACLIDSDALLDGMDVASTRGRGDCRTPGAWFYRTP